MLHFYTRLLSGTDIHKKSRFYLKCMITYRYNPIFKYTFGSKLTEIALDLESFKKEYY